MIEPEADVSPEIGIGDCADEVVEEGCEDDCDDGAIARREAQHTALAPDLGDPIHASLRLLRSSDVGPEVRPYLRTQRRLRGVLARVESGSARRPRQRIAARVAPCC